MNGPFALTPWERQLLPSDDDVACYHKTGWYLSKTLFSADELDEVQAASEAFYGGSRDRSLPVKPDPAAYWEPSHGDIQRHNDYICYETDAMRRILCKPLMGAVAAMLMGTSSVRLWSSTLIYKPARHDEPTNIVPWHVDRDHWMTCTSDELLTAFIPLHDCDEQSGTLSVIEGSNNWEMLPPVPGDDPALHFADRPRMALDISLRETARHNNAKIRPVPVVIERGVVSFHHCRTYHSSGPNTKDYPRRVVTVRFQDEANRWRPHLNANGEPTVYSHDVLVRKTLQGHPDYHDPQYCPLIWNDGVEQRELSTAST